MSKLSYKKRLYIVQLISVSILILLSLIGLFFGAWELVVSVSIASVFSFIYLFTLVKGMNLVGPSQNESSAGLFLLLTGIRFIIIFISLLLPALIIRFSNPDANKLRYLYIISATLPFLLVNLTLTIVKNEMKKDGDTNARSSN